MSRFIFMVAFLLSVTAQAQAAKPDHRLRLSGEVLKYVSHEDSLLALIDVAVIDGTGEPAKRDHVVLIEQGRIHAVGPLGSFDIPERAKRLRLAGHTVIPGLVGMHEHTHMPGITFMGYTASRLWLAGGVTTVQTAGSAEPKAELALARDVDAGRTVGPKIFPSASYITGPGGNAPMPKPASEEEARKLVREWSRNGATWFKLYRHVEPHIAAAVIDEVHAQGRKITGHLCSITYREAASMGIDGLEHGLFAAADFVEDRSAGECVSTRSSLTSLAPGDSRVAELIDFLVERGVAITSTLAIIESHFPHRPQGDERSLALMSPAWRKRYDDRQARLARNETTSMTPELLAKLMDFERAFVEVGGRLLMGSDPGRHVLPGYGNQRGFELLVEAGLTVPQAVQIATANGADALGVGAERGRIVSGYVADLVVLRGDLIVDPASIRNVEIVFKDGAGFDPEKLMADVRGLVGVR